MSTNIGKVPILTQIRRTRAYINDESDRLSQ